MTEAPATDVLIEPADSDDAKTLVELWIDLADDQRRYGSHLLTEANRPTIHETIRQHIISDTVLVARRDGTVVGFVTFGVEIGRYGQDVSRGIVHNIYVRERDRFEGIGHELMAAVETTLEARGIEVVSLEAMAANDGALRFYRRLGYEPHRVELEKPINSDDDRSNGG